MKVLKESGTYLENKARLNRNIAIIFFIIGGGGLLYSFITVGFWLIYIFTIILGIGGFFLKNYANYSSGLEGEKLVAKYLQNLNDGYYLINDVKLPNSYGNIDHIILCQNGIFVIETKNLDGEIRCDDDLWYQYKPEWKIAEEHEIKSPSKQVKGNALRLKQFIETNNIFKKPLKIWIEGIVVFTNSNVELHLNNPTVSAMKTNDLCDYIKNKQSRIKFSSQELESIGTAILMQAQTD